MENQTTDKWDLGLFAASVSELTVDETVSMAGEHGYSLLEWRVQTEAQIAASPWGPAKNTLAFERLGKETSFLADRVSRENLNTCGLQIDMGNPDREIVAQIVKAAVDLGCPRLRVEAPAYDPRRGYIELRDAFLRELDEWVQIAGPAGVQVCLETHFGTIAPSASLSIALLTHLDPEAAGIMWDPANTVLEGYEDPALALEQMGSYLAEVHLKNGGWWRDSEKGWRFSFCSLSEGILDWQRLLCLLHDAGYAGPLVLEDYRPADPEVKLNTARSYLNELMDTTRGGAYNV